MGSARLRRVQRLLAAFPYLLRSRIRPLQNMKRVDYPSHVRDPEFSLILYPDHGEFHFASSHPRQLILIEEIESDKKTTVVD